MTIISLEIVENPRMALMAGERRVPKTETPLCNGKFFLLL